MIRDWSMAFGCRLLLVVFAVIEVFSLAVAADNSLVGDPIVSCGPDRISVQARSELPFQGVVYIKNWRRTGGCFRSYDIAENKTAQSSKVAQHSVPLSDLGGCGMEMRRKASTKELEIFGVFVFSFHPLFTTVGDRAFAVHCIFRQRDVTVNNAFQIGDLVTRDTLSRTASMPSVALRIVAGGIPDPALSAVRTVRVGDKLMFVWHLPAPSDMYGLRVRDCTAEAKGSHSVKILEDGCSLDDAALEHVSYVDDMSKAFASAEAFKFADSEDLWFKCTVSVCMKGDVKAGGSSDDSCFNVKPCSQRTRRDLTANVNKPVARQLDDDLLEQRLVVLDSYNQDKSPKNIKSPHTVSLYTSRHNETITASYERSRRTRSWQICMRKSVFALTSSAILVLYAATFVLAAATVVVYCRKHGDDSSRLTLKSIRNASL